MKKTIILTAILGLLIIPSVSLARPIPICCIEATPIDMPTPSPTPTPTPEVRGGGGSLLGLTPTVAWVHQVGDTYSFLSTQFGFAYLEDELGNRTYGQPAVYHTLIGKGTLYFVQVQPNGYEFKALEVK